jgi:hypothetical protein
MQYFVLVLALPVLLTFLTLKNTIENIFEKVSIILVIIVALISSLDHF